MSIETEIQTEVEALRERFPETKELYREVCALLFFRYGITPTTNKLYQFVRKGSMSAPADALDKFWGDLRSKARIEVDHPAIPDTLKSSAAEAIAAIWQQATGVARAELNNLREEVAGHLLMAQDERSAAVREASQLRESLTATQDQLSQANLVIGDSKVELEAERRAHTASAARLQELQRSCDELRAQLERQRADFSADLAKAREAVDTANSRADASDRRALLEIDQERQAKARVEKQLEVLRGQHASLESQHRDAEASAVAVQSKLQSSLQVAEQERAAGVAAHEALQRDHGDVKAALAQARDDLIRAQSEAQAVRAIVDRLTSAPAAPNDARGSKPSKKKA